nr:hypothetical protein [Tanacetum cinerariifolium]
MIFDGMVWNVNNKVSKFLMYPSPSFLGRIVPLFPIMLVTMGEGSGTPTEPHHTHPPLRQYTRRARIAQSSALPTVADKHASPLRDDSQGEACPTVSGLEAEHDRANIIKTSALPSDSTPRVTSLAADEGSMQQTHTELTDLCTHLQRQQTEMASKIAAQDLEISQLKARVKLLEDRDGGGITQSGEDALIEGRSLDEGEEAVVERGSDDTEEMVTILTSLDAASILTSGVSVSISPVTEVFVAEVPTGSGFIPTASPFGIGVPTISVPTGSGVVPTASPIFTTANVATPYTRRKGKEKMVESEMPKKNKLQEQIDVQMARQLEEEMERDAQRMNEQIARDVFVNMFKNGPIWKNNTYSYVCGTPTEPHHTPSPKAQQTSPTTHSSPTLPPVTMAPIPTVTPSDTPYLRQYTRRARIDQSLALPPIANEPTSPLRDVSQGKACPTELMDLCTSLQRQQSDLVSKFEAQELEINRLKARVKLLEDREGGVAERSGDDAPIKGRNLDKGEEAAERVSDDTEEMATILTSIDVATGGRDGNRRSEDERIDCKGCRSCKDPCRGGTADDD